MRNIILVLRREDDDFVRAHHEIEVLTPVQDPVSVRAVDFKVKRIPQKVFASLPETMFRIDLTDESIALGHKLESCSLRLGDIIVASWGARGVPIKEFHLDQPLNKHCRKMVKGKNIGRYSLEYTGKWLLYDPKRLYRPAFPELFESEKIIVSKVTGEQGLVATFDDEKYYTDDSLCCCIAKYNLRHKEVSFFGKRKISISPEQITLSEKYNLKYVLGLLNSRLLNFYFRSLLGYGLNVYPESIEQLPIRRIDFDNPEEKKMHDDLVALVERMLELNKRLRDAVGREREELERRIERTDREIDELVYRLYGLTEEEINIVEKQS